MEDIPCSASIKKKNIDKIAHTDTESYRNSFVNL